jgi:hypothetical protein
MKVRPIRNFRHVNYPSNTALDCNKIYDSIPAKNQPRWQERGAVFVESPNGAPEMLLFQEDYEVVSRESKQ